MTSLQIVFCILLILGVYLLISNRFSKKDRYLRFASPPYTSSCEFQPACLWDTARWVQLSNGMEGNCILHGIACPSFEQDHNRIRNMGLSPDMVDDRFARRLREGYEGTDDVYDQPSEDDYNEGFNLYDPSMPPGMHISQDEYNSDTPSGGTQLALGMGPMN